VFLGEGLDQLLAQLFLVHEAEAQYHAAFVAQKEMPRSACSLFITSPSFMSAAMPGITVTAAPAASAPAPTF